MSANSVIEMNKLSPKAVDIINHYVKRLGVSTPERVVEELAFAIHELEQLIDTSIDPLLEPEAARRQMEIMRGTLQRFKRFEE